MWAGPCDWRGAPRRWTAVIAEGLCGTTDRGARGLDSGRERRDPPRERRGGVHASGRLETRFGARLGRLRVVWAGGRLGLGLAPTRAPPPRPRAVVRGGGAAVACARSCAWCRFDCGAAGDSGGYCILKRFHVVLCGPASAPRPWPPPTPGASCARLLGYARLKLPARAAARAVASRLAAPEAMAAAAAAAAAALAPRTVDGSQRSDK